MNDVATTRTPLEIVELSVAGALVAEVVIHGTTSLNVVDRDILERARDEFAALLTRTGLRCVLLRGPTGRAFIGGANLHALRALNASDAEPFIRSVHGLCAVMRAAPVPVIALLRGHCLGAGMEIAAACDVRIGDGSVQCGMPEVRVGVPSVVEAALLPGLIGWGKTRELLLRGHLIDAREAATIGFLQHLVSEAELMPLAQVIAHDIVQAAPGAVAAQKRLFLEWEESTTAGAIEHGVDALVAAYAQGREPAQYIERFFAARQR